MFEIKNDNLVCSISDKAAEVHVLKKANDEYNYVWCGDANYWAGRNPILFPQVSSNAEKSILVDGVKYITGNHGFARNSVFELIDKKDDEVTLALNDSEDTLRQYPFKFELKVNYKLVNNRLNITYTITNKDNKVMPFGFGLHPAFACNHDYKDTKVVFNNAEDDCGNELIINKELFEKYHTYHIDSPKATLATLITGDKKLSVEYEGYKIFAIWSSGDFVCLEPWMNSCPKDIDIELKDRPGSLFLKPNESTVLKYAWIVEE